MELSEERIRQLLGEIAARNSRSQAEQGMEILYRGFGATLRNYLWKNWPQDTGWIDEVIQDTFLEVWKHPERFRGESMFKTSLIGVARHKAMDVCRKERPTHEPLDDVEDTLAAEIPTVTDIIQEEQIRQSLKICLESLSASGKLSAAHREVLYLAYVEDQDGAEMAQILGCPESTVKTRLHYARLRIKDCLRRRLREGVDHD